MCRTYMLAVSFSHLPVHTFSRGSSLWEMSLRRSVIGVRKCNVTKEKKDENFHKTLTRLRSHVVTDCRSEGPMLLSFLHCLQECRVTEKNVEHQEVWQGGVGGGGNMRRRNQVTF